MCISLFTNNRIHWRHIIYNSVSFIKPDKLIFVNISSMYSNVRLNISGIYAMGHERPISRCQHAASAHLSAHFYIYVKTKIIYCKTAMQEQSLYSGLMFKFVSAIKLKTIKITIKTTVKNFFVFFISVFFLNI